MAWGDRCEKYVQPGRVGTGGLKHGDCEVRKGVCPYDGWADRCQEGGGGGLRNDFCNVTAEDSCVLERG